MTSNKPIIALLGSTGFIGSFITPVFLEALKQGRIKELRVLSSNKSEKISTYVSKGAKFHQIDFTSGAPTLTSALKGVDVAISTLAKGSSSHDLNAILLEGLKAAGVKAYIPSEFGTNHYTLAKIGKQHPFLKEKVVHLENCRAAGVKTVAVLGGLIMEHTFGPWLGFGMDKWNLLGNGEVPVAMSSVQDIARLTLEVAVKVHQDPQSVPELVDFHSDLRTLKEYAEIFDRVAGQSTALEFSLLEDEEAFKSNSQFPNGGPQEFGLLLRIYMADGTFNNGIEANGNKLFNPDEKVWKLKKIEDFARETGGRPMEGIKDMVDLRMSLANAKTTFL